jgi:DNA end-binding protein Ku
MSMPQAVWTGPLAFGLVSIPVKLYNAVTPKAVRFHQFERDTGRRIRYQRVASGPAPADEPPPTGESVPDHEPRATGAGREAAPQGSRPGGAEPDVPWGEIVKGFEIEPGRVVTVSPDELAELRPARSRSIDVEQFVELEDLDPLYFDKSYYVIPQAGAEGPFALLVQVLAESGKVAVGRFVMRTREHLSAIRSAEDVLLLHTLFFADEIRDPKELWSSPLEEPSDPEMRMARQLIDVMAGEWEASRYRDDYRERVLELLRSKSDQAFTLPEPDGEPLAGRAADLMQALKASVEAAKRARQERADAPHG